MARVIAVDADGELSQGGALTNTLFTRTGTAAQVGDVGTVTIKTDTVGWNYPDFSASCTPGLALSLDGVTYATEATALPMGLIDSTGTLLYVKCVSARVGVVSILLPQTGIVEATGSVTIAADVLTFAAAHLTAAPTGDSLLAADALTATAALQAAVVDIAGSITISASALTVASALQTSAQTGDALHDATALTLAAAQQASDITGGATISPNALTAVAATQDPTTTGDATISPSELTATGALQAPTVSITSGVTPLTGTFYLKWDETNGPYLGTTAPTDDYYDGDNDGVAVTLSLVGDTTVQIGSGFVDEMDVSLSGTVPANCNTLRLGFGAFVVDYTLIGAYVLAAGHAVGGSFGFTTDGDEESFWTVFSGAMTVAV